MKRYFVLIIGSSIATATCSARAATMNYTLDHVILADGEQITGTFDWTYAVGDFAGGSGAFVELVIPHTTFYTFELGNLNIDIQVDSIEISGDGSFHDAGLDITMKMLQPFTASQPALMDLGLSFFECCGNGFQDQEFQSGGVVPAAYLLGDFDFNNVVDGLDFLQWQRGQSPLPLSQADLNAWETNFGTMLPVPVWAAPEPSALALALAVVCLTLTRRLAS